MRLTALLLTGVGTLAIALAVTVQAREIDPGASLGATSAGEAGATAAAEPAPMVHRAVIPGLAADWTPAWCSTRIPDPCALPITQLNVMSADGERTVTLAVEIANRSDERHRGLMFRESMDELAGMLFVFQGERYGGFWMKNTLIPLDIAYLGADGTVLEIVHGVPLSLEILTPSQGYRYTLEVNDGWFERHGFGVGDRVEIPEGLDAW